MGQPLWQRVSMRIQAMRQDDDVLFELIRIGHSVKVIAVDARTGVEVSTLGPAGIGEATLKRNALAKLEYVLARRTPPSR